MQKTNTCIVWLLLLIMFFGTGRAQEAKRFGQKGVTEAGGSFAFTSTVPVENGQTRNGYSVYEGSVYIGYFVADGIELGVNPLGVQGSSYGGSGSTQLTINAAAAYNFRVEGKNIPFVEGIAGVLLALTSGYDYGLRAGVKNAVAERVLVTLGVQYLLISYSNERSSGRYGSNQFMFSVGVTVW